MNSSVHPKYDTTEYQEWHETYDGTSPPSVIPVEVESLQEALDCLVRLSLRIRYFDEKLTGLASMNTDQMDHEERTTHIWEEEHSTTLRDEAIALGSEVIELQQHLFDSAEYQIPERLDPILEEYVTLPW